MEEMGGPSIVTVRRDDSSRWTAQMDGYPRSSALGRTTRTEPRLQANSSSPTRGTRATAFWPDQALRIVRRRRAYGAQAGRAVSLRCPKSDKMSGRAQGVDAQFGVG